MFGGAEVRAVWARLWAPRRVVAEVRGWGGTPEGTDMPWGWRWGVSDCGG